MKLLGGIRTERLAAAAGRRVGAVRQMHENGPERVPGPQRVMAAEAPDVRPSELTVTATVTVMFALTD